MNSKRKKIFAVDDNLDELGIIKNALKALYEVYPCSSAPVMFDLLEHVQPDLILLDVEMLGMNGYETIKKLKSFNKYREIPVMFLTSMSDEQSEIEGLKLGAVDYIRKPFVTSLLLRRVETHIALQNILNAKSEFLSHMSHEIRSPLNAVIGMITIASGTDDIQRIKYCLERADNASRYLLGLINDILDMSKIEANKLELSYMEINIEKMLAGILNVISVRADEKHQQITVNVNENVPPYIIGDELRLSQVITNLFTNAIKFTPDGGKIELNAKMLEDAQSDEDGEITLRIEVADNGIGISPEKQKRLFTSYNQADNSISNTFGGTGLGLAISKRIVELMQGKIWIESELDKGSKFIFTIKAKKGTNNSVTETSDSTEKAGESNFNFSNHSILAAEDVEINREILSALLEKTGISIDFAKDGKAAVSMYEEHPGKYSLILMDIHMPEMDGYEATRQIRVIEENIQSIERNMRKQIPIIAMTADVFREDIEKCISAGMNDHIGKPVFPDDLYVRLKMYLSKM
jgi:signal transduction histidine kinase